MQRYAILPAIATLFAATFTIGSTTVLSQAVVDLRIPDAPAASILDITPVRLQAPSIPKKLMATIAAAQGSNSTTSGNLAFEVAPFWIFGGDSVTFEEFNSSPFLTTAFRTLAVSIGTSGKERVVLGQVFRRQMSLGFRTEFVLGDLSSRAAAAVGKVRAVQEKIVSTLDMPKCEEDKLMKDLNEAVAAARSAISDRVGFQLELGVAVAGGDEQILLKELDKVRMTTLGAWLTPTYRFDGDGGMDVTGGIRFRRDLGPTSWTNRGEAGLRLAYSLLSCLSVSAEAVARTKKEPVYTLASELKMYDVVSLVGSYGTFEDEASGSRSWKVNVSIKTSGGIIPLVGMRSKAP